MHRSSAAFLASAALYALVAAAITWPLVLHLGDRVPNDLGDSLLNVFLLAWNAREIPFTERWWNLPQFYPIPGTMAFSEHLLGLSIISTPAILATGNALLGYNLAFLLSFPLCALAAHLLGYELSRRHDVALVAGLAYGFAPYRMSQLAHVQVLSSYWMPLALLGLHLFLRRRQIRWLVLFAVAWYLQALACGYYLFYLSVLVVLWLAWFTPGWLPIRDLAKIGVAWAAAAAALAPVALGYVKYQRANGLRRWPDEIEYFSADIASLLSASGNLRIWGWLNVFDRAESALFPGLVPVLLIAGGVAVAWSARAREARTRLRVARSLLAAAALFAAVACTPLLFGPWRLEILGIRLLSVSAAQKPLSIAVLFSAVALAWHPSIRAGWARRSALAFYVLAAIAMWLFSLGPSPTLMGEPVLYKAPYAWLMMLPGVDGVRVPARFFALATLCVAVAGALGFAQLTARWPKLRPGLAAAVPVLLVLEAWPQPINFPRPPDLRPARTDAAVRLELPLGLSSDVVALYRAAEHRLPVFNGYSGYFARHYDALRELLAGHDDRVLDVLASFGPLEVVVDHHTDATGAWRDFVGAHPQAELVHHDAAFTMYRLPRMGDVPRLRRVEAQSLQVARLEASVYRDRVPFMLDGDLVTRWDTGGPMRPGNEVWVDLGSIAQLRAIDLQIGGFTGDFPRNLAVETSRDGSEWSTAWTGSTAMPAFIGALEDPRAVPLRFQLDGRARYIRLRQTGRHEIFYWSIAELRVFGE